MHYYPHHIGDFNAATRNLSWLEKHSYRELIELYYDTEQPIENKLDELFFLLGADTEDKKQAIKVVLKYFFKLEGEYYVNERCEKEISEYRKKISSASKAGKASARKRKQKKNERPLNARLTNQEPRTNNQEPITKNRFQKPTMEDCADHIAGKVNNPTATAEEFYNHFEASGWMIKGGVKMKSWRAALNGWVTRGEKYEANRRNQTTTKSDKNDEALRKLYS